jgi:hypothetical protein
VKDGRPDEGFDYDFGASSMSLSNRPSLSRTRSGSSAKRFMMGQRLEYWNAGVESFNTVQEVALYRGYNTAIETDHVVLTFHMNDLETTPVAFLDEAGRLVVYALHQPATRVNAWLFEMSYLYSRLP